MSTVTLVFYYNGVGCMTELPRREVTVYNLKVLALESMKKAKIDCQLTSASSFYLHDKDNIRVTTSYLEIQLSKRVVFYVKENPLTNSFLNN